MVDVAPKQSKNEGKSASIFDTHETTSETDFDITPHVAKTQALNPDNPRFSNRAILQLQRTIGNQAVQRLLSKSGNVVQRVTVQVQGAVNTNVVNDINAFCVAFNISEPSFRLAMKAKLFASNLLPATYKQEYDNVESIKSEVDAIITDIFNVVHAQFAMTPIVAVSGREFHVADKLLQVATQHVNANYLRKFPFFNQFSSLGAIDTADYLQFLKNMQTELNKLQNKLVDEWDAKLNHQHEQLQDKVDSLINELHTAITSDAANPTGKTANAIAEIKKFVADIPKYEIAWNLDFDEGENKLEAKVTNELENSAARDKYKVGGGTEDDEDVEDDYEDKLACTLHALLAVKPSWLGAQSPEELHHILRKSNKLKAYDVDRTVAKIRYLAGLKPTVVTNKSVYEYLRGKKQSKDYTNVVVDPDGEAHTFAAVWKDKDFVRVDNETKSGNFAKYGTNKVITAWQ